MRDSALRWFPLHKPPYPIERFVFSCSATISVFSLLSSLVSTLLTHISLQLCSRSSKSSVNCPQPLDFSTQKSKRSQRGARARGGRGREASERKIEVRPPPATPLLLPFCAGVQFSRRCHRALIDRKNTKK